MRFWKKETRVRSTNNVHPLCSDPRFKAVVQIFGAAVVELLRCFVTVVVRDCSRFRSFDADVLRICKPDFLGRISLSECWSKRD